MDDAKTYYSFVILARGVASSYAPVFLVAGVWMVAMLRPSRVRAKQAPTVVPGRRDLAPEVLTVPTFLVLLVCIRELFLLFDSAAHRTAERMVADAWLAAASGVCGFVIVFLMAWGATAFTSQDSRSRRCTPPSLSVVGVVAAVDMCVIWLLMAAGMHVFFGAG